MISLSNEKGDLVIINEYGATITSWIVDDKEKLYCSPTANMDGSTPIRGGIPLVFPQFGNYGSICEIKHGFARSQLFKIEKNDTKNEVIMVLEDCQQTKIFWNYEFRLEYKIILNESGSLVTNVMVKNVGLKEFRFNFLFHTYFLVSDLNDVKILSLKGCKYFKGIDRSLLEMEGREKISINGEVDSVYINVPCKISADLGENGFVNIKTENLKDLVIWNPWKDKCSLLLDMPNDDYKKMVCIETCTLSPITLESNGGSWSGGQEISFI